MSDETTPRTPDGKFGDSVPTGTDPTIGRYRLERMLGNGAFGRVYLAFDPEIERHVAIKTPILAPDSHRAFLREARAIADIHHENVCPVYDVGTHQDVPYIVMRFVRGGTFADLIERAPPKIDDALKYVTQIANGLEVAHARGVVHRDLKPANVLYDEATDTLLLTDFGLARWFDSGAASTGGIKGTPNYMPPEQWGPNGPFGPISPRTDVYSLGVILYRLLTGVLPFTGSILELLTQHCQVPPRRPSEVKPGLDPRFDALCLTALAKQPCDRYESAKAFAQAVTNFRTGSGSGLIPVPGPVTPKPGTTMELSLPLGLKRAYFPRGLKMVFCWIPAGECRLGSPPAEQKAVAEQSADSDDWLAAERESARGVYKSTGFWLGKFPVTQAEWYALTGGEPSYFRRGGKDGNLIAGLDTMPFPVEGVSWDMICGRGGFLEKLNAVSGIEKVLGKVGRFALPHEDDWEYASRGGRGNSQPFYWGGEIDGTQANVDGGRPFGTKRPGPNLKRPTAVGTYEAAFPHPWGLCDMHGNVWEWCANLYERTTNRVLRGGAWNLNGRSARAAARYGFSPSLHRNSFGFRVIAPAL
jgi:serine/threonine protein kinase